MHVVDRHRNRRSCDYYATTQGTIAELETDKEKWKQSYFDEEKHHRETRLDLQGVEERLDDATDMLQKKTGEAADAQGWTNTLLEERIEIQKKTSEKEKEIEEKEKENRNLRTMFSHAKHTMDKRKDSEKEKDDVIVPTLAGKHSSFCT